MAKPVKHYDKWRIRWIDATGVRRSAVFETYREADVELKRRELEAEGIRSGTIAPPQQPHTFDELADYWLAQRAPGKRSRKDDESIIRRHLRPSFGALELKDITVTRVDAYVTARRGLEKKTVNNHLTLLKTMLSLAVDLGWLTTAPRIRKPRVPLFRTDYRYLRTQEEIDRLLDAARLHGEQTAILYATAVYTGMRKGEHARLQWSDVDFERRLITVQRSFGGLTKAERVRYVPILDPLLPLLRRLHQLKQNEWVFNNTDGGPLDKSSRLFEEVLHSVLGQAGFPNECQRGVAKPYVTFHDLRHTFASHWVMNGGDIFKLQKILGHQSIEMTMRYAHLAPEAFAADYGRLGSPRQAKLRSVG